MSKAADDVVRERVRQVTDEGYTPARDDAYTDGELAGAAMAYLQSSFTAADSPYDDYAFWWPEDWSPMKRKTRREDLVRAGGLVIAEIERLDRTTEAGDVAEPG